MYIASRDLLLFLSTMLYNKSGMFQDVLPTIQRETIELFTTTNMLRSVLILIGSLILAYWLSNLLAKLIVFVAQRISTASDTASDELRAIRLRQIETYLSIAVAAVRVAVVAIVGYIGWRTMSPLAQENTAVNGIAAIGAGTIFIVIAGQTIGMILRDLTAGAAMIAERWFTVGDYIKVEPFIDVAGVVERFTLRSTRIRALNGEVIWLHNQTIHGVHVTPRGVRTIAVDVFVNDRERGEREVQRIIDAIPIGKTMLAQPLRIKYTEKWGEDVWRLTVVGKTPPGREWLIDAYFLEAVKAIDEDVKKANRLLVHSPIARFADSDADRRFNRAVRVMREKE